VSNQHTLAILPFPENSLNAIENTMPYYIYKITPGPTNLLKTLEKVEQHASYKEARDSARTLRSALGGDANHTFKVIFAASELEAEELLMEKREEPILREWEK